jgi:hypothetical protein
MFRTKRVEKLFTHFSSHTLSIRFCGFREKMIKHNGCQEYIAAGRVSVSVTLLNHILEVFVSNLGGDTGCRN